MRSPGIKMVPCGLLRMMRRIIVVYLWISKPIMRNQSIGNRSANLRLLANNQKGAYLMFHLPPFTSCEPTVNAEKYYKY